MRMTKLCLAALLATVAMPAAAQDDDPTRPPVPDGAEATEPSASPITLSGNVTLVSDYRFRGVSLSGEDAAIQGTLNVAHESGIYGGVFASTLDDAGGASAYGGSEIDFYVGYSGEVASGTTFDVGLLYYLYPDTPDGGPDVNYFEPYVSLAHTIGPVTAKVGAAYAWDQGEATADESFLYLYGQASTDIPGTPINLLARLGHQDLGYLDYWEWQVGATLSGGPATVGIAYVDTDQPDAPNVDGGAVFSLAIVF